MNLSVGLNIKNIDINEKICEMNCKFENIIQNTHNSQKELSSWWINSNIIMNKIKNFENADTKKFIQYVNMLAYAKTDYEFIF